MKHRKNYRGDKIIKMLEQGMSYKDICKTLNIESGTISFYKKKFGLMDNINWQCCFCKQIFVNFTISQKGNHARWCTHNPDRDKVINRDVSQMLTPEAMAKKRKSISLAWINGCYKNVDFGKSFRGKKHRKETIELMRNKALKSTHRRLVRSTRKYQQKDGSVVLLDSSWEEALAKRLDELCIKWVRPITPLKWIDHKNIQHNYFPDFFLTDYNIYLDPKNPAAYNNQQEKVNFILKNYKNVFFLRSLNECTLFNIARVAQR